jgi:N-acetylglucosaminyl-diphospho-decaprenol L-rhamnosyltransferase
MPSDARLAVVIITRNRRDELLRTLGRLQALPEQPPVVVVDNGSTDGTSQAVAEGFPAVDLVSPGRNLGAVGRNLAMDRVNRPYVAFCDDDTWWDPGALAAAADYLDGHPRVAVVTGRILVEPGATEDPICEELRQSPLPAHPDAPGFPLLSFLAGASMVRREAFVAAGGFHPRLFLGGEEELLASDLAAAGWAMVHVPEVVVHHQASTVRDPHLRRRQGIRNTIWFSFLRRPLPQAVARTARLVSGLPRDRTTLGALADAARGAPWVWRERRVVPPDVEAGYRLLEPQQRTSKARRYVS